MLEEQCFLLPQNLFLLLKTTLSGWHWHFLLLLGISFLLALLWLLHGRDGLSRTSTIPGPSTLFYFARTIKYFSYLSPLHDLHAAVTCFNSSLCILKLHMTLLRFYIVDVNFLHTSLKVFLITFCDYTFPIGIILLLPGILSLVASCLNSVYLKISLFYLYSH